MHVDAAKAKIIASYDACSHHLRSPDMTVVRRKKAGPEQYAATMLRVRRGAARRRGMYSYKR